jgi:hypothetical protein
MVCAGAMNAPISNWISGSAWGAVCARRLVGPASASRIAGAVSAIPVAAAALRTVRRLTVWSNALSRLTTIPPSGFGDAHLGSLDSADDGSFNSYELRGSPLNVPAIDLI